MLGNRIVDTRSEWRTFANSDDNTDDPSRVGGPSDALLNGKNHIDATLISKRDGHSGLSRELNRAHAKANNVKAERALATAFKEIQAMSERLGVPKVVADTAKQFYRRVETDKILKGRPGDAVLAACLFMACRQQSVGRTFKELCQLTTVPKKEIGRCFKGLQQLVSAPALAADALASYVSRFASHLSLSSDVRNAALALATTASTKGILAGKSPITIVAACFFFVSQLSSDPRNAKDIAAVCGCTEATLRNSYKYLHAERHFLLPSNWTPIRPVDQLPPP